MTKITPFSQQIQQNKNLYHSQTMRNIPQYQADSFEFIDEVIEDKPTKKSQSTVTCSKATQEMALNASMERFGAIRTKQEVEKLISIAQGDYTSDLINNQRGLYVTFEKDNLGRIVMTECDLKGREKRQTTFYESTGEVHSIKNLSNPKLLTKFIFFGHKDNYFEIRKESNPNLFGQYKEEVYSYRNNRPEAYTINTKNIFSDSLKKEQYMF